MKLTALALVFLVLAISTNAIMQKRLQAKKETKALHRNQHHPLLNGQEFVETKAKTTKSKTNNKATTTSADEPKSVLEDGSYFNYEGYSPQDLAGNPELLREQALRAYDAFNWNEQLGQWDLYDLVLYNFGWAGLRPPGLDHLPGIIEEHWSEGNGHSISEDQYVAGFQAFVSFAVHEPEAELYYQGLSWDEIYNDDALMQEYTEKTYQSFSYAGFFDYYFAYEFGLYHSGWAQIQILPAQRFSEALPVYYDVDEDYNLSEEEYVQFYEDFMYAITVLAGLY